MYTLSESYKECHKIFKKHAKSYYIGALLFDYKKFMHVCAFYGLVRVVDDSIDLERDSKKKIQNLNNFERNFFEIFNKDLKEREKLVKDDDFWINKHIIMRAVINTVNIIGIKKILLEKFFKSMRMDLNKFSYKNYQELEEYMDGSAAIIGEVMLQIIRHNNDKPVYKLKDMNEKARDLGFAFQLTNFIRDIREDHLMKPGRIYIPLNDQMKYNCDINEVDFDNSKNDKNLKELLKFQLDRCDKIYKSAQIGIDNIDKKYRNSILVAKLIYSKINDRIKENNYDISERTKISSKEKLYILFKTLGIIEFIKVFVILLVNYIRYNLLSKYNYVS